MPKPDLHSLIFLLRLSDYTYCLAAMPFRGFVLFLLSYYLTLAHTARLKCFFFISCQSYIIIYWRDMILLIKLLTENSFISLESGNIFVVLKITHWYEGDLHMQWKSLFPQGYLDDNRLIVPWQQYPPIVLLKTIQVLNKLLPVVLQLISRYCPL